MRHTNWEKTDTVFRGRKRSFTSTSSFAVWALLTLILISLASVAGLSLSSSPQASAVTTVPTKLNFQGRLTDSTGNIKPNGTYNMRFKLYTVATAGTSVWSEDRLVSATQGVTVTNGLFSVQLGSITSLPASLFASGALYLEVELPTPATATTASPTWTEGPMTPRNQMATSAYAYNSETLDGQDGAYYLDAGNLTGTMSSAQLSGSYTGITAVGTLTGLTVSGGLNTGNLTIGSVVNQQITLSAGAGNHGIEVGRTDGTASTPYLDFHSGATSADYDARIVASAGTGSNGGGALTVTAATTNVSGNLQVAGTTVVSSTRALQNIISVTSTGAISGTQLTSTVATGTAPLTISSTTKVTSLNADLLDGLDSTAFGDATAANQTTILNRIGTNADAAGTGTVFARLASIDTSKIGATGDAANATGSIFARLAYLISSIGATTDAASSTGSVNAKLAYIIANLGGGVASDDVQVFSTSGTWTKPAGAKYVDVYVMGGGGGGASGNSQVGSGAFYGGNGGSGGGLCAMKSIRGSSLAGTISVSVGSGGSGGAAYTRTGTTAGAAYGNAGSSGGSSAFGTLLSAPGGGAGGWNITPQGGVGCTGTGGAGGQSTTNSAIGADGGAGTGGAPGGGGQGGAVEYSGLYWAGGAGGFGEGGGSPSPQASTNGLAGSVGQHYGLAGATGANGGNGAAAMPGGAGGAGSVCGAGGGGGGSFSRATGGTVYSSGAGGSGATGCVVVVTHF